VLFNELLWADIELRKARIEVEPTIGRVAFTMTFDLQEMGLV
jgi:hypothetical protein